MPQPYFSDLAIECWQHSGKLGLATPAFCLYHSSVDLGRPILRALDELCSEEPPAKRTLTFQESRWKKKITKMRLLLVSARDELRVLNFACEEGTLTIEMTAVGLTVVRDAVTAWVSGAEDFGIAARHSKRKKHELGNLDRASGELWFWGPTMEP